MFPGTPGLALELHVSAVARLHLGREGGTIASTVRVTPGSGNTAVAVSSLLLLVTCAFLVNVTYN
jgi:hypothetical protein